MKAITLWQPWASLVAMGVKTVETRSWATSYRGPLAIHAATRRPDHGLRLGPQTPVVTQEYLVDGYSHPQLLDLCNQQRHRLPLGAVVATCTLTDVVPMVDATGCKDATKHLCIVNESMLLHSRLDEPWPDGTTERIVSEQGPYGDFAPGRYAWLLEDVRPLPEPVPARGRQRLWDWR